MRRIREAWQCDCDGVSHEFRGGPPCAERASTQAMAGHMEKLTGHRPPTCPWRAFSHPLVREVLKIAGLAEKLGAGAIEAGTPALIYDALHVYWSAVAAVRNHDAEERRKREEMARKRR